MDLNYKLSYRIHLFLLRLSNKKNDNPVHPRIMKFYFDNQTSKFIILDVSVAMAFKTILDKLNEFNLNTHTQV